GKARAKGEDAGSVPHVKSRTDTKGRKQPAKKKSKWKPTRAPYKVPMPPASNHVNLAALAGAGRGALIGNDIYPEQSAEQRNADAATVDAPDTVPEVDLTDLTGFEPVIAALMGKSDMERAAALHQIMMRLDLSIGHLEAAHANYISMLDGGNA